MGDDISGYIAPSTTEPANVVVTTPVAAEATVVSADDQRSL